MLQRNPKLHAQIGSVPVPGRSDFRIEAGLEIVERCDRLRKLLRPRTGALHGLRKFGIWIFLGAWSLGFGAVLEITTSSASGPWVGLWWLEPSAGAARYPAYSLRAATPLVRVIATSRAPLWKQFPFDPVAVPWAFPHRHPRRRPAAF